MAINRSTGGAEPVRPEAVGQHEERRSTSTRLATATLACPACDAPVAPGADPLFPRDAMRCPVCDHGARVRDFLSLEVPTRPARVQVRVVHPMPGTRRPAPAR